MIRKQRIKKQRQAAAAHARLVKAAKRANELESAYLLDNGFTAQIKDDQLNIKHQTLPTLPTLNNDPWIHRSENMKCKTCMWFVEKGKIGRCRRHAPIMSGYPVVYPIDWCGDHKLDENKV